MHPNMHTNSARTHILAPELGGGMFGVKQQTTKLPFPDGTVPTAWDEGAGTRHQGAALVSPRRA